MRSVLTMLGIIIGVGAVIAMVGIGQGADQTVQRQIANLGSNMLFVSSGSRNLGGLRLGWGATKTLVREDVAAIVKECPAVAAAAPGTQTSAQVVYVPAVLRFVMVALRALPGPVFRRLMANNKRAPATSDSRR